MLLTFTVRDAIHACKVNGQPITKDGLSSKVGVKRTTLFHYPAVRALMTQSANVDQQQRRDMRYKKREEELAKQVVNAIQQLRDTGSRVSVQAVGKIVHVSSVGLHVKKSSLLPFPSDFFYGYNGK